MNKTVVERANHGSPNDPRYTWRVWTSPVPLFNHADNPHPHGNVTRSTVGAQENLDVLTGPGSQLFNALIEAGAASVFWGNYPGIFPQGDKLDDRIRIEFQPRDSRGWRRMLATRAVDEVIIDFVRAYRGPKVKFTTRHRTLR